MNFSPSSEHFSRLSVLLILLASAVSCTDQDEPGSKRITAQFNSSNISVAENAGQEIISVQFGQPAPTDGEIVIKATAVVATCFSTTPITELNEIRLRVSRGDQRASFIMTPTDNQSLDGSKVVKFAIVSMSSTFTPGVSTETIVTVTDDEAPVAASFSATGAQVRENVASAKIEIDLATAAPADGVLLVKLESLSSYGVEYATEPAASNGKIFLPVAKGASSVSIKLYAVNDQTFKADRNISFKIVDATGGVVVGEKDSFWCTITEDDGHQLSTIASIRSRFVDESVILQGETYIEGIVTSIDNVPGGRIVVEDVTGALTINVPSGKTARRGDVVLVNITNGVLHEGQNVLEVGQVADFEKLGEDAVRVNKISLYELLIGGSRMESRTIQLVGVSFADADGTITFSGDRVLTDGQHNIIVRTAAHVDFAHDVVPQGLVNVTGIYANRNGVYVLYPQEAKDIKKSQFALIRH